MTHPFHPLSGCDLEFIERSAGWGEDRVLCLDAKGRPVRVLASWTSVCSPDPWVVLAEGRTPFRFDDLLEMTLLVAALRRQ